MSTDKSTFLNHREFGKFSELIHSYLDELTDTQSLHNGLPNQDRLYTQAKIKSKNFKHRETLHAALENQMNVLDLDLTQKENLEKLKLSNTVTITTGHQLNLMTGPLYFFYKILQTIKATETLNAQFKDLNFVPVFWMATEDHDFEEINHFFYQNQKITWQKNSSGPVGRYDLKQIDQTLQNFEEILPHSLKKDQIISLINQSYLQSKNLKEAHLKLVQLFFAEKGLLIIDGDDRLLKKLMIPAFEEELLQQTTLNYVTKTNQQLINSDYNVQVNPREINLFYMDNDQMRERIIKTQEGFEVNQTSIKFTSEQILIELHNHPEKFSPNVLLRPLYQETILPNIAYIGGSGEIAYWLQLKSNFEAFKVDFPLLIVRNSALIISAKQHKKLEKLDLQFHELFQPLFQLTSKKIIENVALGEDLKQYEIELNAMFDRLQTKATATNQTFQNMVLAQKAKQLKGIKQLNKRLLKAEKIRQSDKVDQIETLYNELFPFGNLQERITNFSEIWMKFGKEFIEEIYQEIQPWDFRFIIKTLP